LTYKNFNTDRVMRWRLLLEEFGPELFYVKGNKNIPADFFSRCTTLDESADLYVQEKHTPEPERLASEFGLTDADLPEVVYPLLYRTLQRHQKADASLLTTAQTRAGYTVKNFRGGGTERHLVCRNDRIVVPSSLRERIVDWYHEVLCHPGVNRTEKTIRQHFTWHKMSDDIKRKISLCPTCQRTKKHVQKYGHLPPKEAETAPWEQLCVDLVGPYQIRKDKNKVLVLHAVTMIDPATG
jgi:hypothetical protein